ncbi:MAG: hypothetical protein ACYC67_22395 [Prosthecobacter sp.]
MRALLLLACLSVTTFALDDYTVSRLNAERARAELANRQLRQICVDGAIAEAGARPETIALRISLHDPALTDREKRIIEFKLDAIHKAAEAAGKQEYLRIAAIENAERRQAERDVLARQTAIWQAIILEQAIRKAQ